MTCGRARRLLWPDGGPRVTTQDVIDAQQHLAQCEACQQFVREMRAYGEALREAAPRDEAPAEVRRRLFTAVARARAGLQPSSAQRVPVYWLIAAITLLVVLGGALTVDHLMRHAVVDPMLALAEDHVRALSDARLASTDTAAVRRWLTGQVHFAVYLPVLPNARLLGARLRMMDGQRGAALEYEVNGVSVSYFVVPDGRDGDVPPSAAGRERFERSTRAGYRIVAWREPGLLHAMVGFLSESQLATLAVACIKQARGAAASLDSFPINKARSREEV